MHENDPLARWTSRPLDYVSQAGLDTAVKTINHMLREQKTIIKDSEFHPAYNDMREIVEKVMRIYKSDFYTHDKMQLGKIGFDTPFLWLITESHTHFLSGRSDFTDAIITYEQKQEKNSLTYWYTGQTLKEINASDLREYYNRLPKLA